MMSEFYFRTEDIRKEDIPKKFVSTERDEEFLKALKGHNPVLLEGSRGVGKSFMLRMAETQLLETLQTERILPVYVQLNKAPLIQTGSPVQFRFWTLASLIKQLQRALRKTGLLGSVASSVSILANGSVDSEKVERIVSDFERSWENPGKQVDAHALPDLEDFKDSIEDLCDELSLKRVHVFFDEAAHVLIPEQQRQFFTLFRDLRSPYLSCNAAIYPGVTSFGETFDPAHDATLLRIERDVLDPEYVKFMEAVVRTQADDGLKKNIEKQGENFAVLAYAACGNPRILLKTVQKASKLNSQAIAEVIRDYYRTDLWAEHSALAERYGGYKALVDWGRNFVEEVVLANLVEKNQAARTSEASTTRYFWVHRDAPEVIKHAIHLLMYTGVVIRDKEGFKGTHGWVGTRYAVNLGALFAKDNSSAKVAFKTAKGLSADKMIYFGRDHEAFKPLVDMFGDRYAEPDIQSALADRLKSPISVLDITAWQLKKLEELQYATVGNVLRATEGDLMQAKYVGEARARQMRNAAEAAVLEYLSG